MKRFDYLDGKLRRVFWPVVLSLISLIVGCQRLHFRSQSPEKETADDGFETTVKTPFIGQYITFAGLNLVTLEGVGLVTGLDGTGGDPPPSSYRTRMYEEMKKRGVRNSNEILRSSSTALVIVRAYLPPLIRKGEHFDVEVRLPEGSEATGLNGGWLLDTYLAEQAIVPGQGVLEGHIFAKARGPILISTGEGDVKESLAGVLRRGRILGGGRSVIDRNLTIYLRNDFRSVRNSKRIATRIGQRFHAYDRHGINEPLAEAKTDQTILLKVPRRYKDNYPRYLQVIRNIPFRETIVARRVRMEKLKSKLQAPNSAERAALQLEAIGQEAIPVLQTALEHSDLEVRFHAAMALAYLENTDGLEVLADAARRERAFRVYALAGLAAIDDVQSIMLLRDLLNAQPEDSGESYDSAELRYGAFRALWTLDKNDPTIRGDSMNGQFSLHVLHTQGEPIIHLTHRRRAEIVLFGADQEFLTPMAVRAGNHILVTASSGSKMITVSRYEVGREDQRKTVSARVADVIRTAAEFGASYPDVAQMIIQANKQNNLSSRVEIDALPRARRVYRRGNVANATKPTHRTRMRYTPNLFSNGFTRATPSKQIEHSDEVTQPSQAPGPGTASLADVRNVAPQKSGEHHWTDYLRYPSLSLFGKRTSSK